MTTIAIPTYAREDILVGTIHSVLRIAPPDVEILVIDQTLGHKPEVSNALAAFERDGRIRRYTFSPPSITHAMNIALEEARTRYVLFLDDDIVPEDGLIEAHLAAHRRTGAALVAGRIIQPWHKGVDYSSDETFHFAGLNPAWIEEFMGGNFSVDREIALSLGGFDENFVRVAYNFEAEFAHRLRGAGHCIYFEPAATVHHLKVSSGGTRTFGEHLKTARADHCVGAYYFILVTWRGWGSFAAMLRRPIRSVSTRHHLRQPWWIPLTLIGEFRGLMWALLLALRGPKYVKPK